MKSKKMFVFEYMRGVSKKRVPVPSGMKYNPEMHFQWFEESDYLNDKLNGVPYATFKTDDQIEMENLIQNGFKDESGVVWTAFFAYWKDTEGHAFLCPESANIKDLRDVGVLTIMKSPADFMKVAKYTNRLFAALPKTDPIVNAKTSKVEVGGLAVWGKEVSFNPDEDIAIVHIDVDSADLSDEEKELAIRYVDLDTLTPEQKAIVDGAIIVSEKAVRLLGLNSRPRLGMAWRGTFGTERGLGKGHILYKDNMSVDIVIYGPKTILKGDQFYFGSMGELHVGKPHTDRQAFVNFHFHRPGLGLDLAKSYMRKVFAATRDEESLRRTFLSYSKDDQHADMDNEDWMLRRALAYDVSYLRFPGLYRKVTRYLMEKVMATDERARIPMDDIAYYGYVLPDPDCIDESGNVVLDNAIEEGCVVFPDLPAGTQVVCYRQPSENTNAHVFLKVVERPEYKRFKGRGICLLGKGALKVLGRLGGGDMDDQFVIIYDPKWVEAFHTMPPYPETEKLKDIEDSEEDSMFETEPYSEAREFANELMEDITDRDIRHYTNKHVSWQIDMAKNARAGIGPVVNFGMMDMLMSDPGHLESMMNDLLNRTDENADEAASWLDQREPWQAAMLMSNLETVIDGNVKDQTLLRKLGDVAGTIRKFHEGAKVYPACLATGLNSRVPKRKIEAGDYVVARSLMCHCLEQIAQLREQLQEVLTEREWALVAPADRDLRDEYPRERDIVKQVRGLWKKDNNTDEWIEAEDFDEPLLAMWARLWREELSQDQDHEGAYERICQVIENEVLGSDNIEMEAIAAEIYYQTYRRYEPSPKIGDDNKLRSFSDGLLWSPVFGNHFINALRRARLAGFYKAAHLRPEYRSLLMNARVLVDIRDRQVYIQDENDVFTVWVGYVLGKSVNGKFYMESGLIQYRAAQPICRPDNDLLPAQKPLTRIIKSKVTSEKDVQVPEPKGFGKLLGKVLGILGKK